MPRLSSTVALAALLVITIIFLIRSSPSQPAYYRDVLGGRGLSLNAWLNREETRYAKVLRERQQLITKWGPTYQSVNPYPSSEKLYTIWDFFIPAFQCPHLIERIGTLGDGGKWVCGMDRVEKQKKKCVIYSFGINGESSFEQSLLQRAPGCEVWGYDFSVTGWGPEITDDPELSHRAHFEAWALGGTDMHGENDHPKWWTLDSLMKLNGHTFVDILKVDIEGGEFDALTSFVTSHAHEDLPIGQLQIEIHAREGHERFDQFARWWESLEAAGLRPFWTEPNMVYVNVVRGARPELAEYSFMNVRGNHALVSDSFN